MSETAGVYMLQPNHAAAIEAFAADPAISASGGAAGFVAARIAESDAGTGFPFAIEDRGNLVGLCWLEGVGGGVGRGVGFWVGSPFRGKGYATFGVRMLLEFAFRNLSLAEVRARLPGTDAAARRVLDKNGFRAGADPLAFAITAEGWRGARDGPALERLHPGLKTILDAERAAGNEVMETGVGWPDADSVFVRLRHPFRVVRTELPKGVRFTEVNDPHWWTAEYGTDRPRHILAY